MWASGCLSPLNRYFHLSRSIKKVGGFYYVNPHNANYEQLIIASSQNVPRNWNSRPFHCQFSRGEFRALSFTQVNLFAGSTNTVQAGMQTTNVSNCDNKSDVDLDSMCLLLDPHLRPATPDLADPRSKALFEEHKQLAQEYLTVKFRISN